jgi:hypothetical protein
VTDYHLWKAAFRSDPIDLQPSGVRRYRVLRPVADPDYVKTYFEFDRSNDLKLARYTTINNRAISPYWDSLVNKVRGSAEIQRVGIRRRKLY